MFYDWILTTSYLIIFFIFSTINFIFYLKYLWINFMDKMEMGYG